ncbi:acyl carrier protein [Hesseltinella vesiculosa]|uniref:Acyl carrier protein n=1 Tax=Hesseltinella vesiculosa TaxID=101127 RepID=A0A1X2GEY2_9FUNG|nr:acyl carrier protein [Hesseltinella vesiculosa]
MLFRPTVLLSAAAKASVYRTIPSRFYTATALSNNEIQTRILDIVKGFDKVDQNKVTVSSNFVTDLGLDSLDTVELVMAIEEDFSVEIPDKDADEIKSVTDAIKYISTRSDAQ